MKEILLQQVGILSAVQAHAGKLMPHKVSYLPPPLAFFFFHPISQAMSRLTQSVATLPLKLSLSPWASRDICHTTVAVKKSRLREPKKKKNNKKLFSTQ